MIRVVTVYGSGSTGETALNQEVEESFHTLSQTPLTWFSAILSLPQDLDAVAQHHALPHDLDAVAQHHVLPHDLDAVAQHHVRLLLCIAGARKDDARAVHQLHLFYKWYGQQYG